ncbi:uncharacterized protein LOC133651675 isoform X2 [Entelurus aequoreus]|nr:uncharacterized protein LOC133651675 isoform X2 [Entelurus aequoreus]XP_061905674.1 uncharacterized protein LOC133651675 isoform X2 [Entelurus aequoreus]XP_061905675.1 uncharacterized protein LOC133651675 isoform X2 [Entelurus aequoreus]
MSIDVKETDQRDTMLLSSEEDSAPVLRNSSAPLDFLTPSDLDISLQSFTPNKVKSGLTRIKIKRRSSVSSVEFCDTPQQKMKNLLSCQSPESLMDVEESKGCDPMPRQDDNNGRRITAIDYLSDKNSQEGGKENHPPVMSPAPSKRRRVGPLKGCQGKIRYQHAPFLHLNWSDKEDKEEATECSDTITTDALPSSDIEEEAQPVLLPAPLHGDSERAMLELQDFSSTNHQQDDVGEPQRPVQARSSFLTSALQDESSSAFQISSLQSLLDIKVAEEDSCGTLSAKNKRKRVHFGGPLSPELYDKHLPPSTPLQKGETPVQSPRPGGVLKLRSVLRKPQRNEPHAAQDPPDFGGSLGFGASSVLAMPRRCRMPSLAADRVEDKGKSGFYFWDVCVRSGAAKQEENGRFNTSFLTTVYRVLKKIWNI